jgi:large conductance mechanosensitive channel
MAIVREFLEFLQEYKVTGLLVAFTVGAATNDMVKSFVNNIIMALLNPLLPGQAWTEAVWTLGPVKLGVGAFSASLLNFLIIALVVFLLVRALPEEVAKRK